MDRSKTNISTFQTKEGLIIHTTSMTPGIKWVRETAVRKAIEMKLETLYSVEPNGRKTNFTDLLNDRRNAILSNPATV